MSSEDTGRAEEKWDVNVPQGRATGHWNSSMHISQSCMMCCDSMRCVER